MRITLLAVIFLFLGSNSFSRQTIVEKYGLPVYDCENMRLKSFFDKEHIIIIPDDTTGIGRLVNFQIKAFSGDNSVLKSESEVTEQDYLKPILVTGPIKRLKKWDKLNLPFSVESGGFTVMEHVCTKESEGFTFLSDTEPMRIVISGNSDEAYQSTMNNISSGFDFIVHDADVVTIFGNFPDKIFNMDDVKKDHYSVFETKYYIHHLSLNLDSVLKSKLKTELENFDNHVEAFVKKMELSLPLQKIESYIHADQTEISYLCGFFHAPCGGGKISGFYKGGIIHAHRGKGSIKHETNHLLFNQINNSAPTFLGEGIQTWYENYESPQKRESGIETALEFINEDITDVILTGRGFHQGKKYYRISGIFTDYLIETYGLNKFKELYGHNYTNAENAYIETYGKPLHEILAGYKSWLALQNTAKSQGL